MVKVCGIKNVRAINPNDLKAVNDAFDWAMSLDEASVIITRWPCVLKKLSKEDKQEFNNVFKTKCVVNEDKCIGCKSCIKPGCPAISFDKSKKEQLLMPIRV